MGQRVSLLLRAGALVEAAAGEIARRTPALSRCAMIMTLHPKPRSVHATQHLHGCIAQYLIFLWSINEHKACS